MAGGETQSEQDHNPDTGPLNQLSLDGIDAEKGELDDPPIAEVGFWDIAKHFILLGWTAFGGPAAHVALFQKLFVEKLQWMSSVVFLELLALGQCLPGPTSTQISFAIGVVKKGIPGGLLSGILFQYPGLLMMSLVGVGVKSFEIVSWKKGISDGLAAVAVALVVNAAKSLSKKICTDKMTSGICVFAAIVAYYYPKAWTFPGLILIGGIVTLLMKWKEPVNMPETNEKVDNLGLGMLGGAVLVFIWLSVLIVTVVLESTIKYANARPLHWFASFYRTGSLIFGGGQVVLPLIINEVTDRDCPESFDGAEVCPDSWITPDQFYLGLGIVQAMPGPLFNFSAYLGALTATRAGYHALIGISTFWFGLFSPGILLIYGVLPFWASFRKLPVYRKALPGFNAAAVGLIITAVFSMLFSVVDRSDFPTTSVGIGMVGFALVDIYNIPASLVVILGGLLGFMGWGLDMK